MKYSACIEMLYSDLEFTKRIHKAARAGFHAVEFWLWQNKDLDAVETALKKARIEVGIFQGNTQGRMVDPRDKDLYLEGVMKSVAVARRLGTRHLFLMADILKADRTVKEAPYKISPEKKRAATMAILKELAPVGKKEGITFVIEPLNVHVDHKGYSLDHSKPAFEMVREIGSPNIKVLYDVYHMQIMEGNLIQTLRDNMDAIGYVHIADVPGRHEPGTGEINFANIFGALKALKYRGNVGFEFEPTGGTDASLKHIRGILKF